MTRIAAVDLGSLTVRLAVAEVTGPGRFRVLLHRREITGLGREVAETGQLARPIMDRTLEALRGFAREMAAHGVGRGQGVATQAVRQARNGPEFFTGGGGSPQHAGAPPGPRGGSQAVPGRGVDRPGPESVRSAGPLLVFDLGGGSTEFTLVRRDREPVFAGLPLGVLSLSRARPLGDPPLPDQVAHLKKELRDQLDNFYQEHFRELIEGSLTLVGTAGSVTTLAAMAQEMTRYDPKQVNNYLLTRAQVAELAERLAGLPEAGAGPAAGHRARQGRGHGGRGLDRPDHPGGIRPGALVAVDAGLLEGVLAELACQ